MHISPAFIVNKGGHLVNYLNYEIGFYWRCSFYTGGRIVRHNV